MNRTSFSIEDISCIHISIYVFITIKISDDIHALAHAKDNYFN